MIPVVYFDSKTGNVARFARRLAEVTPCEVICITAATMASVPGHLITYTTRFGDVPERTACFVKQNLPFIRSVSSSGNRNWGKNFAKAADRLAQEYGLPVLLQFELSGTGTDINQFINAIQSCYDYQKVDTAQ